MAKYKHVCRRCGREYEDYWENSKFCSRECYSLYREENSKYSNIQCPICKREFRASRTNSKFCSVECRIEATRTSVLCVCDCCGVEFTRAPAEYHKRKRHFCSVECRKAGLGWSREDTTILKNNFGNLTYREMQDIFSEPKSIDEIKRRAEYIGLTESREWSKEEVAILIENYHQVTMDALKAMLPKRTRYSIIGQARQHGLLSHYYLSRMYSEEDNNFLKDNYLKMTDEDLGRAIGRSASAIAQRLSHMGLYRPKEQNCYNSLHNYIRSRNIPWRNKKMRDACFTCAITGKSRDVVIHHIYGFSLILREAIENTNTPVYESFTDYSQEQLDVLTDEFLKLQDEYDSAICISKSLHNEFHRKYGYGNNTPYQWNQFTNTPQ